MKFEFVNDIQKLATKILVVESLQCDGMNNTWLEKVAKYSIENLDYSNLQLSYINPKGELSFCVAGWKGTPYFTNKINQNTIFSYASVTKVFTSELILDLVRQHQIDLEDKLVDFLPEINENTLQDKRIASITISDLLSHRAGFDRNITSDTMLSPSPWCPHRISNLNKVTLDFSPNIKNVYSNVGYCLLAQVIEQHYSKSYIEVSEDHFDLNNSQVSFIQSYHDIPPNIPNVNKSEKLNQFDFFALASVGGLVGSSTNLSQYIYAMDKSTYPNVISRPKNASCNIKQIRGCHGFSGYEYSSNQALTLYWRDGRLPKFSSIVTIDSDGGVLALLSNSENESTWLDNHNKLVKTIYDNYLIQRDSF